jgi:tetratricopeptide (TPR) repeat protein
MLRHRPTVIDHLAASLCVAALVLLLAAAAGPPALAQGYGGTVADILARAESLLAQNRANEAIVQYQEALTLCTTPAETVAALQGEARAHMAIKEFLPAAGLLEEAAQRFPDDPRMADILFLAGIARRQGGDPTAAAPLLRKALEHDPTPDILPSLTFELARALRFTGKPDEVVELLKNFETTFAMNQLIPNALYALAIAQHDAGDLAGSEATYRHLIDAYPHTQATLEAFFELGQVLAERGGRRAEAAEFFRRYANGAPGSPVAARSMERAADLAFFSSPKDAALLYGVAQAKAFTNETPAVADLQVSRWLGTKKAIAGALSSVWVVTLMAAVALALAGGAFVLVRRRRRGGAAPAL